MTQPDLRTLEGASTFINYSSPAAHKSIYHKAVNDEFQILLASLWKVLPEGPGKTRFVHALNHARMEANSCIQNEGA